MPDIRFGLIGYGAWGSHHARCIAATTGAQLTAICSRSDASRQQAAQHHPQARIYADYRELLDGAEVDVVDVVLPSDLHYVVANDVLMADRHLLLEKPMTLGVAECDELIRLAGERGRLLAVGHELRLSSLWGKVKSLVDEGAIGEPLYALIELWRNPYRQGSGGWRYDLKRVGNWVLEEPIHFFDLARWYFARWGDPVSVFAQANGRRPDQPHLHDNFSAIVSFPAGRYAVVSQSLCGWQHHQVAKITGTAGAIVARWSGAMDRTFEPEHSLELMQGDQLEQVPIETPSGEVYELAAQIESMTRAVRDGTPLVCSGADGRWSVAMCLGACESIAHGRPVTF